MLFTLENGVPLSSAHALGASVVWHHSLLLMNSFNRNEAAVFSCRLCFLRAILFVSLIEIKIIRKETQQNDMYHLTGLEHGLRQQMSHKIFDSLICYDNILKQM